MTIPEPDLVMTGEIKILISQLELYDEQIQSVEFKINKMMKQIDSKIMSIPGIGGILGPIILGEIGNVDRFSSAKKLIAFAGRSLWLGGKISIFFSPPDKSDLFKSPAQLSTSCCA